MTALPFWAPLALLGFAPWMILTQQAVSLIYQFWIHTERPRCGLTKNLRTFRPTRVAFHEFVDLARDVRGADG